MRKVKTEEAIGMILGHDVTRIVTGGFKGAVFKKGHIIREEDIPLLLDTGNDYVHVLELGAGEVHEDEAGLRLARAIAGAGVEYSGPEEGKVSLRAKRKGLLRIDVDLLEMINATGDIVISTLHDHTPCDKGALVAATRIIPLTIAEEKISEIESRCGNRRVVKILPYQLRKVGVVVTGNEVYYGRIKDTFDDTVGEKVTHFGAAIIEKVVVPDDVGQIAAALQRARKTGAEVLLTTGGLSVDPGDVTRIGIQEAGAEIVSYGSPLLPGAMFLYALLDGIPLLGLPACVFYAPTTIFDVIFPRVLAGERITRNDIIRLGHGGLCLGCEACRYPVCHLGKG